jgi:hypothetical protein
VSSSSPHASDPSNLFDSVLNPSLIHHLDQLNDLRATISFFPSSIPSQLRVYPLTHIHLEQRLINKNEKQNPGDQQREENQSKPSYPEYLPTENFLAQSEFSNTSGHHLSTFLLCNLATINRSLAQHNHKMLHRRRPRTAIGKYPQPLPFPKQH